MPLEIKYEKKEDVPVEFASLYTERNGAFVLTGINGIKTQDDIDRLQGALANERDDHKKTRDRLKAWGDLKPEEVLPKLDEYPALKALEEGGDVEKRVQTIIEKRTEAIKAPLERQIAALNDKNKELDTENQNLRGTIEVSNRNTILRQAAAEAKVAPTAIEDILVIAGNHMEMQDGKLVTKSGAPVAPGLDPIAYFAEMQQHRPHWWPQTAGGGGRGGGGGGINPGDNPFSAEGWNLTKQGQLVRTDPAKAKRYAELAGTTVGGPKPVKKN